MKILIVRTSALGDIVHTFPALMALRAAFPQAHIGWAVEKRFASLLAHIAEIDTVHPIDRKNGLKAFIASIRSIQAQHYDISLDFQGLLKSAVVSMMSRAPRRIGFSAHNSREGAHLFYNGRVELPKGANITAINNTLVEKLSEIILHKTLQCKVEFPLFTSPQDAVDISTILKNIPQNHPFALINPGGAWHSKLWGAGNYAQLASDLKDIHNLETILTCFGDEKKLGDEINALLPTPLPILTSLTYTQQAELSKRATIAIGPDTGPLHIAHAVHCPTIFLFGASDAWRNTPSGPHGCAIQAPYDCKPCWKKRCPKYDQTRCMQSITPALVIENISKLLARSE